MGPYPEMVYHEYIRTPESGFILKAHGFDQGSSELHQMPVPSQEKRRCIVWCFGRQASRSTRLPKTCSSSVSSRTYA